MTSASPEWCLLELAAHRTGQCVSVLPWGNLASHFLLSPNSNLVAAYEKAKKKHQNKLKKLESQMMAMVERHETQVRMLKQRIALLEEENSRPHTNETSL